MTDKISLNAIPSVSSQLHMLDVSKAGMEFHRGETPADRAAMPQLQLNNIQAACHTYKALLMFQPL
jgi:hypothetical protein